MRFSRIGWFGDSYRHSMAARGYRTSFKGKSGPTIDINMRKVANRKVIIEPFEEGKSPAEIYSEAEEIDGEPITYTETVVETDETGKKSIISGGGRKQKRVLKPSSAKQREENALQAELKLTALKDYNSALSRISSGSYAEGSVLLEKYKTDPLRQTAIRDAMFKGAIASADRGEKVDDKLLKKSGLSDSRIELTKQRSRFVTTGRTTSALDEADIATRGLVGGTARFLGTAGEEIAVTGLKNIRDASGQPSESAIDRFIAEKRARESKEKVENFGLFNPLRVAGLSVEDSDADDIAKKIRYKDAHRAEQEVDSVYNRKMELASINTAAFEKGNKAFLSGKRNDLIDAITELESENGKIKDRWNVVQDVRKLVLTPQNRDQLVHMERNDGFGFSVLGGSGAGKISDETKKISEVERSLKNSSNKLSAMTGVLRNKLKRLNAAIPVENSAPAVVDIVSGGKVSESDFSLNSIPNMLDNSKGKFRGLMSWSDEQ